MWSTISAEFQLPCESENVSRPVMVFIHPGGFYGFSGQSTNFGPQYLMDQDIVLVTINYRLGALGNFRRLAAHAIILTDCYECLQAS